MRCIALSVYQSSDYDVVKTAIQMSGLTPMVRPDLQIGALAIKTHKECFSEVLG